MDEGKRLARRLHREHRKSSWRALENVYNVPAGTLCRIEKTDGDYLPKRPEYRERLGLSKAICPTCQRKITKPREVREWNSLYDLSNRDIQYLFDHRIPF
jgi:hypothetical protein